MSALALYFDHRSREGDGVQRVELDSPGLSSLPQIETALRGEEPGPALQSPSRKSSRLHELRVDAERSFSRHKIIHTDSSPALKPENEKLQLISMCNSLEGDMT